MIKELGSVMLSKFLLFSSMLLLAACNMGDSNKDTQNLNAAVTVNKISTTSLVVSEVFLNTEEETLTISGSNFELGAWATPEVTLNNIQLPFIEQSEDEIIVGLPASGLVDTAYFLTVKTGDEVGDFDAHGLIPVNGVPSGTFNQLLILDVTTESAPGMIKLKIAGYNFDNGTLPTQVSINDISLPVSSFSPELLEVIVPVEIVGAIKSTDESSLLIVKSGTDDVNYDAYELFSTFFDDSPLLACNRPDHAKVPLQGEHCCTTSGQDLCWKTGPVRDDTKAFLFFFFTDDIPRYFELTEDYEIPVAAYFNNPPPVSFPTFWRVAGDGDPDSRRERLYPLLVDIPTYFDANVLELINTRKWDFLRYNDGKLTIKKGYRWDGASVGWDRKNKKDRLNRTYLVNMRSSLIHDAFYDMVRFCALPCDTTDKAPINGGKEDYRDLADTLFYLTAKEDGHTSGLKVFF